LGEAPIENRRQILRFFLEELATRKKPLRRNGGGELASKERSDHLPDTPPPRGLRGGKEGLPVKKK
jgi:hypothetical protein